MLFNSISNFQRACITACISEEHDGELAPVETEATLSAHEHVEEVTRLLRKQVSLACVVVLPVLVEPAQHTNTGTDNLAGTLPTTHKHRLDHVSYYPPPQIHLASYPLNPPSPTQKQLLCLKNFFRL